MNDELRHHLSETEVTRPRLANEEDFVTKKQTTFGTLDEDEAFRLVAAKTKLRKLPRSACIWSRNHAGETEGVSSHQSTLSIHELSDVNPAKIHITVPTTFRRNAKTPKILVLHGAGFDEKDVERRQGSAVTRPLRPVADLPAAESVSRDFVELALAEGRQRGLINIREMAELRRQGHFPKWFV